MNGYKAHYKGKTLDVYAETSHKAQQIAAAKFGAKQSFKVTVVLCETGTDGSEPGEQLVHTPTE